MFENHTVLLTGPTEGIGRELAELFALDRANLILVSRRGDALKSLKIELSRKHETTSEIFVRDLSKAGAAAELAAEISSRGIEVDVLVNNAGFGVYGYFAEEALAPQLGMIEIHVTAPTVLTHAFLPGMLRRRKGGILNVASTGGFQPVPIENVYCATKAYLLHFTEALAEEVSGSCVRVTCLCPGPTQTKFFDQPLMKTRTPAKLPRMTASDVAKEGYRAFVKGKPFVITGLLNKVLVTSERLVPRAVVARAAHKIVKKTLPLK